MTDAELQAVLMAVAKLNSKIDIAIKSIDARILVVQRELARLEKKAAKEKAPIKKRGRNRR